MWTNKYLTGTACTLMAIASVGVSSAASAKTISKTYSVAFSQSEISTTLGAKQVFARIQDAAYNVCKGEFGGTRFVHQRREMNKCVTDVVQDLVSQANHKTLNKIANSKTERFKQFALK